MKVFLEAIRGKDGKWLLRAITRSIKSNQLEQIEFVPLIKSNDKHKKALQSCAYEFSAIARNLHTNPSEPIVIVVKSPKEKKYVKEIADLLTDRFGTHWTIERWPIWKRILLYFIPGLAKFLSPIN